MDRATREDVEGSRSSLALWVAIVGPALVWAVDQQASFVIASIACRAGRPLLFVVTLATAALLALTTWITFLDRDDPAAPPPQRGRHRFMVALALLSNGLFALVLAADLVPKLLLSPCG